MTLVSLFGSLKPRGITWLHGVCVGGGGLFCNILYHCANLNKPREEGVALQVVHPTAKGYVLKVVYLKSS